MSQVLERLTLSEVKAPRRFASPSQPLLQPAPLVPSAMAPHPPTQVTCRRETERHRLQANAALTLALKASWFAWYPANASFCICHDLLPP